MKLSLKSAPGAMIYNFAAPSRFIGVRFQDGQYVWIDEAESLDECGEYVMAVKRGELRAGDEATAKYCGVSWIMLEVEHPSAPETDK
jgi:hypothetical protein